MISPAQWRLECATRDPDGPLIVWIESDGIEPRPIMLSFDGYCGVLSRVDAAQVGLELIRRAADRTLHHALHDLRGEAKEVRTPRERKLHRQHGRVHRRLAEIGELLGGMEPKS